VIPPSAPTEPVTVEELRKILVELGHGEIMPADDKLKVLADVYTATQYRDLPPEQEWKNYPTLIDALGNRVQLPLLGPAPFDWHQAHNLALSRQAERRCHGRRHASRI
jgi:hypothetical protein